MTRIMSRLGIAPRRRIAVALAVAAPVVALAALPAQSFAQGCAMCGTYLSNGTDPRSEAFKVSIMFLMCMPFLTVLSAGGWILWMHWRSRSRRPALRVLHAEEEGAS